MLISRFLGNLQGASARAAWCVTLGWLVLGMSGCALWDSTQGSSDEGQRNSPDASAPDAWASDAGDTGVPEDAQEDSGLSQDDVLEDATDLEDIADADDATDSEDGVDGRGEADAEPFPLCEKQLGVCAGARASNASGVCSAADYGPRYVEGSDSRICDGRDNNCDGDTDFECCYPGEGPAQIYPGPFEVGEGADYGPLDAEGFVNTSRSLPTVVPAAVGAPEGAAALVVWAQTRTQVVAQYIDRDGEPVGTKFVQSAVKATAATVVVTPNGYDLVWGEFRETTGSGGMDLHGSEIKVQALTPELSKSGGVVSILSETDGARVLQNLFAAYRDGTVTVAALFARTMMVSGQSPYIVDAAVYETNDRSGSLHVEMYWSKNFNHLRVIPTTAGFLVAGSEGRGTTANSSKLWLWRYRVSDQTWTEYRVDNAFQDFSQFDLVETAPDSFLVIFSKIRTGYRELTAAELDLSVPEPTLENVTILAGADENKKYAALALYPRDTDDDGFADKSILLISEGSGPSAGDGGDRESWTIRAYPINVQNPSTGTVPVLIESEASVREAMTTVDAGSNLVAVWQTRTSMAAREKIMALPISFQGPRICPSADQP